MIKDYIHIVYQNLKYKRLRSWLTIIGIVIGIAAVVSLVSLGQGLESAVLSEFEDLGSDRVVISPLGGDFGPAGRTPSQLTEDDIDVINEVRGVEEVGFFSLRNARIEWGRDEVGFYPIIGIPPGEGRDLALSTLTVEAVEGNMLGERDERRALVGNDFANANDEFDSLFGVGERFEINGERFRVEGVNRRVGNEFDDRSIFINIDDFDDIFDRGDQVSNIVAQTTEGMTPEDVALEIEDAMRDDRGLEPGEEDFEVQTFDEILEGFGTIITAVQGVVVGIALISLLVGGIGIMNTMYTSVLQRRKEIGVMKAVGAKNSHVYSIFVLESGFLGFIGGLIGLILGVLFALLVELVGSTVFDIVLINAVISWQVLAGALLFSLFVGVVSGLLPARKATKVDPVEALNEE